MVDRSSRCYSWGSDIKGDQHLRHSLSRSKHGLLCFVAFEPYSVRLSHSFSRFIKPTSTELVDEIGKLKHFCFRPSDSISFSLPYFLK